MINIIKKDLIACFKMDRKIIIKILSGILFISLVLSLSAPVSVPILISYVFIFKSFYIDEYNKCDYLFNSLPIDKEDIVYSKYILATIIILVSIVGGCVYGFILDNIYGVTFVNIQSLIISLSILLILVSITFPILFKYGYKKSHTFINIILGIVIITSTFPLNISYMTYFRHTSDTFMSRPGILIMPIVGVLMYILSMYISIKIYTKKEIAR